MISAISLAVFAVLFAFGSSLDCFQGWSERNPALLPCKDASQCCYQLTLQERISPNDLKAHVFFGCSGEEISCEDHDGVNGDQCFTSSGIETCVCNDPIDPICHPN